jgi:hypothetical protein
MLLVLLLFSTFVSNTLRAQDNYSFNPNLSESARLTLERHMNYVKEFKEKKMDFDLLDLYKEFIYQDWISNSWENTFSEISIIDTAETEWTWTSDVYIFKNNSWNNYEKYILKTTPFTQENPRLLGASSYVWVEGKWIQFSKISYTYKEQFLIETLIEIAVEENTFMPLQLHNYEYNDMELVSIETIADYYDEWMLSYRKTYDYNDMGMPTGSHEYNRRNDAWEDSLRMTIEYDEYDLPVVITEYLYPELKETNFRKVIYNYDYDTGGILLSVDEYRWVLENWEHVIKKSYDYNPSLMLTSITTEENSGEGFEFKERESYDYNENGLETERLTEVYKNSNWNNQNRILTIYVITSVEDEYAPETFRLDNNYPNPFNPVTTISYSIPANMKVVLKVFNIIGEEVRTLVNEEKAAGTHIISFDAADLPSGIYMYSINTGTKSQTKKMILMK